jgi:hypothetical protein
MDASTVAVKFGCHADVGAGSPFKTFIWSVVFGRLGCRYRYHNRVLVVHVCLVRLGDQMWVATLVLVYMRGGVDTTLATVSRCLETWVVQLCLPF